MNQEIGKHHAYILLGNIDHSEKFLADVLGEQKKIQYRFELLSTDEVKKIRSEFQEKNENQTNVIIASERISQESQNSLLKLIEEPVPGLVLFFLFPRHIKILPTIQSRVITLYPQVNYEKLIFPVKDFLKMKVIERLEMIDALSKSKERKDNPFQSYEVQEFLDALESGLAILFHKSHSLVFEKSFQAIRQSRTWSAQTGFPQKNILDYIAVHLMVL